PPSSSRPSPSWEGSSTTCASSPRPSPPSPAPTPSSTWWRGCGTRSSAFPRFRPGSRSPGSWFSTRSLSARASSSSAPAGSCGAELLGQATRPLAFRRAQAGAVAGAQEGLAALLVGGRGGMPLAVLLRPVLAGVAAGDRLGAGTKPLGEFLARRGAGSPSECDRDEKENQAQHGAQPTDPGPV